MLNDHAVVIVKTPPSKNNNRIYNKKIKLDNNKLKARIIDGADATADVLDTVALTNFFSGAQYVSTTCEWTNVFIAVYLLEQAIKQYRQLQNPDRDSIEFEENCYKQERRHLQIQIGATATNAASRFIEAGNTTLPLVHFSSSAAHAATIAGAAAGVAAPAITLPPAIYGIYDAERRMHRAENRLQQLESTKLQHPTKNFDTESFDAENDLSYIDELKKLTDQRVIKEAEYDEMCALSGLSAGVLAAVLTSLVAAGLMSGPTFGASFVLALPAIVITLHRVQKACSEDTTEKHELDELGQITKKIKSLASEIEDLTLKTQKLQRDRDNVMLDLYRAKDTNSIRSLTNLAQTLEEKIVDNYDKLEQLVEGSKQPTNHLKELKKKWQTSHPNVAAENLLKLLFKQPVDKEHHAELIKNYLETRVINKDAFIAAYPRLKALYTSSNPKMHKQAVTLMRQLLIGS